MSSALLLRESDYSEVHFQEFRFPRPSKWIKNFKVNSLFLKFLLTLVLISVFAYFVRKLFFFDFTFAKVNHVLTFFDTTTSKPQSVSTGFFDYLASTITSNLPGGLQDGLNAVFEGAKKVTGAVTTVKNIYTTTADEITHRVLDTVTNAVGDVVGNVSTVVTGVQSTTSGSVISWGLMGGSGILGILLALLFIL